MIRLLARILLAIKFLIYFRRLGYPHGNFTVLGSKRVFVGRDLGINHGTYISCLSRIDIGDFVVLSSNVSIIDSGLIAEDVHGGVQQKRHYSRPIRIMDHVWVGANSTILGGVTIGRCSIIAAGVVVDKDVPPYSILKRHK
jgi:acetyltransferase-like isoleucine patch superfamily enzyme